MDFMKFLNAQLKEKLPLWGAKYFAQQMKSQKRGSCVLSSQFSASTLNRFLNLLEEESRVKCF